MQLCECILKMSSKELELKEDPNKDNYSQKHEQRAGSEQID